MRPVLFRMAVVVLALIAACGHETRVTTSATLDVDPVQTVTLPEDQYEQVLSQADLLEEWPAIVSPSSCDGYGSIGLPFGSAWVLAGLSEDGSCLVWLGGETENPGYDGRATQFCRFEGDEASVHVAIGEGGPARIDHTGCTDLS